MIKIEVHSTRAVIRFQEPLTVGLTGAKAQLSFGKPWETLIRTAVFRQGDKTVTVADIGNEVIIPWEVLTQPGLPVQIGVYGTDSTGALAIPTVWAETAPVRPGADPEGDPSTEPTPGLWEQLQGKMGSLEQLETEEKRSLVGAVNEVRSQIPDQLSQLENDAGYLTEAPVTSVNGRTGAVELQLPSKTSQLTNDSGFLTEAPVTGVNGQTGEVTLPTVVKITLKKLADGRYLTSIPREKMMDAYDAGNAVFCQYQDVALPLVSASPNACVFTCVYSGKIYTVDVTDNYIATASEAPLASGSGEDGMTPHIGDNGNWFIGETDTGMPSRGEDAPKEAVLYTPQDLTPEQRAQARENIGAVHTPESASVGQTIAVKEVDENGKPTEWGTVDLPSGGSDAQWRLLAEVEITEEVSYLEWDGLGVDDLYIQTVGLKTNNPSNGTGVYLRINDTDESILYTQNVFSEITIQIGWALFLEVGGGHKCGFLAAQDVVGNKSQVKAFYTSPYVYERTGKFEKVKVRTSTPEYPFTAGTVRLFGR